MNADFILAIGELGKEKGIDPELLFQAVEEALVTAYKKNFGSNQNVRVDMNKVTGELHIYAQRHIVAEVGDDPNEISLEEARKIDPRYEVDDIVETLVVLQHKMPNRLLYSVSVKQNAAWFSRNFPAERMIS